MVIDLLETTDLQQLKEKLSDPVQFVESMIRFQGKPVQLYDFQKEIIGSVDVLHDRVAIVKSRQVGGSLLCAWMIAAAAYMNPHATFLVVSKTQEQSVFIYKYIRDAFEQSPLLAPMIDKRNSRKHDLVLKNKSVIHARTVGDDATNLRGWALSSNGCLCVDEASFVKSSAHETLLHITHGAGILMCSTPRRPYGFFYSAVNSDEYKVFRIPATRSPRIKADDIERLKKELTASAYRNDLLCEFCAGDAAVFDSTAIDKAIDYDIPIFDAERFSFQDDAFPWEPTTHGYFWSLDVARSSSLDPWVLYIGRYDRKNNTLHIVAYCAWAGSRSKARNVITTDDPRSILRDLNEFRKRFPPIKVYVDSTSNEWWADCMHNDNLYNVEKVVWTQTRKQLLLEHLSTCLSAEKIAIPNSELVQQLIDMSYDRKRMEDDTERLIYLGGSPDDHVDSLAMLGQVVTTGKKYEQISFVECW